MQASALPPASRRVPQSLFWDEIEEILLWKFRSGALRSSPAFRTTPTFQQALQQQRLN